MQVHTFLAASVQDAVAQIRETLGPEAVVLNVRRLPVEGLARLWQKPRIEVLAHVPAPAPAAPAPAAPPAPDDVQISALAELRAEMRQMRNHLQLPSEPAPAEAPAIGSASALPEPTFVSAPAPVSRAGRPTDTGDGEWCVGAFLESSGLLPLHAERIVTELRAHHGEQAPLTYAEELQFAQEILARHWRAPRANPATGTQVFIGAPGAGKTTALCKWLAQATLVENRAATVWRLDGQVANTAESLSVFAEILGVPVERFAPANGEAPDADLLFVDLPGINPHDATAVEQLAARLATLPNPQVHLVLNAAYESSLLLAQARAFAKLPVTDLIVTHLDEESRWGKVWNLMLGTNCSVRFLAAGQNIPGDFLPASAELILSRQFPLKTAISVAQR
jgi:flagellar biosynthesis protein FlhF